MSLFPLGSVVKLKKAKNDIWVMITDKYVKSNHLKRFVEYSGVVYPDGQIEDIEIYFNSEDIQQVFFEIFLYIFLSLKYSGMLVINKSSKKYTPMVLPPLGGHPINPIKNIITANSIHISLKKFFL